MKHFSTVKRPLCLLLVLAMLLGVMPASVFASDDVVDLEDVAQLLQSETVISEEDLAAATPAADAAEGTSVAAEEAAAGETSAENAEPAVIETSAEENAEAAEPAEAAAAEESAEAAEEPAAIETSAEENAEAAEPAEAVAAEESAEAAEEPAAIEASAEENAAAAEPAEEAAAELPEEEEVQFAAFFAEKKCNGIEVSVSAPYGVFPADARLKVKAVFDTNEYATAIGKAVDACREEDRTVAQSYIFDIKVVDGSGEELVPDTAYGNVSVSFAVAQSENENLSTEVYHITDVDGNEMTAHSLETEVADGEVFVETDGFSYYVIELSYETITYRVSNYDELTLDAFLAAIGLTVAAGEEVLDITSSNTAVLSVSTNEDDETILIPEGKGVSHITVTIGEDYDTAVEYKADFSIATRDDKVIPGSEVVEEPTGDSAVTLEEYTGEIDFTLTTAIPTVKDVKIEDSSSYESAVYAYRALMQEYVYAQPFVYNGDASWVIYDEDNYRNSGNPAETVFSTGVDGLQILPFAGIIGKDDSPEVKVDISNGKIIYDLEQMVVKNQYYYAYSAYERNYYTKSCGLAEDHDLSLLDEIDLKIVYGYAICDPSGNLGYVVIGETNAFNFSASGLNVSYENYYLAGFLGAAMELTDDITVSGPNGPYTISVTNEDQIDWVSGSGGDSFSYTGFNDQPVTGFYYPLECEIADNDGEIVYNFTRYLYLVDKFSACFSSDGESFSSSSINIAYVVTDADLAAKYNASQEEEESYYNSYGPSYVFTESEDIAEELKSCFYSGMSWCAFPIDPDCVELVDDGGYESPWVWDPEEADDIEDLFVKVFTLVYEVSNPYTDSDPCEVTVRVGLMRPADMFTLSYDLTNGAASVSKNATSYATDGQALMASETALPDVEIGDTSFWLYQFLDWADGDFRYESYLDGESDFTYKITASYGSMLPMMEYVDTGVNSTFLRKGSYDESGHIVLDESSSASPIGYKISGALDITRAGSYRIEIIPVVDGAIREDLTVTFTGRVVPKRAAAVTMENDTDLTIYKPFDGVYTAEELSEMLQGSVTAKDEYGNSVAVEVTLKDASGNDVSVEDAAAGMAEGDAYTVSYTAVHEKDLTVFAQKVHTVTVPESSLQFTGTDSLTVAVTTITDFDHAIRGGVKATLDSGKTVAFTYTTDYTMGAASGTYTITYTAVHPGTGKTYTAERVLHVVAEDLGSSVLSLTLEDTSATQHPGLPGQDPENFILGTATQDAFTFTINYSKGSAEDPSVEVYIPYGFELQGGSYTTSGYTATLTGDYSEEEGSVLTLVPGVATTDIVDDITLIPHLEVLYPALKTGYTDYIFTAQSFDGGAPCGICTAAGYTFTAKDELCTPGAITVAAGTQEFTVSELFGNNMRSSSSDGSAAYQITVTKPAGKLPDPDWKLNFTLPSELGQPSTHPYRLVFLDADGQSFASTWFVSAVENADGSVTVPLYGSTRYSFETIDGDMTYMDAVRRAAEVRLCVIFSAPDSSDASVKINMPAGAEPAGKGVADDGVMTGSEVSFFHGEETAAMTAEAIGVRLVNGLTSLESAADATILKIASYAGAPSKSYVSADASEISAGGDGIHAAMPVLDNLQSDGIAYSKWGMYRNLEVTTEYPYEYSPVAPYSDGYLSSYYYDVYYTVSTPDENGNPVTVADKENLKATLSKSYNSSTGSYCYPDFDVDESLNEYVSSVTVKYKNDYQTILNNWSYSNYIKNTRVYNSLTAPVFQTRASYVTATGAAITEPYTVTVTTSAIDDHYSSQITTQTMTVIPTNLEMKVYACDGTTYSRSDACLGGSSSSWDNDGIIIGFYNDTSTKRYTNAKLVIAGEAVRLANFSDYDYYDISNSSTLKVVGYSTSSGALKGPWAEGEEDIWVTGSAATKAAARKFRNVKDENGNQIPVTGVILDISGFTYSGSSVSTGDNSYLYIRSYPLNSDTMFFDDLTKTDLETDGYSVLNYSVYFHSDNGDANLTAANGKTAPISAGRFVSTITQKNPDYVLNPMAGSADQYSVSTMKLISVSHGTTQRFTWEGYLGYHNQFTTVFESDGSAAGDALMSLAEGLYAGNYRTRITSVEYQTMTADGKTKTKTTGFTGYDEYVNGGWHKFYTDSDLGSYSNNYVSYAPFDLEAGEYVTKVTVHWANFSDSYTDYSDIPSVALLRVSAVPEKTRSGYTLTAGEQLPCKVTTSYKKYDGSVVTLPLNGTSAKMCGTFTKSLENYNVTETLPVTTPKKGTSFEVCLNNTFAFADSAARLGDTRCYPWLNASATLASLVNSNGDTNFNKLRYTVYYRISDGFEYVAGSLSSGSSASASFYPDTFADGSGLLKIVCNSYRASTDGNMTIRLRAGYDVEHANIAPVLGAWLDISYDVKNSQTERNYSIIYGSSAVALDEAIISKLGLAADTKAMFCNLSDVVFPNRADANMFDYTVTASASNGAYSKAEQGVALAATADSSFGVAGELVNTASDRSTDWNIYIPVPTEGKTVSVLENTGLTQSAASEFSLKLKESAIVPEDATVTYTTAADPAFNALTGSNGGEDGEDYVSAEEITDWSAVTAIHIYVPEVTKDATKPFSVTFSDVEKTAVGSLKAYTTAYYNYRTIDGRMLFGKGGISSKFAYGTTVLNTFVLEDYYITGTVWNDLNKDGIMMGEPGVAGITVKAVGADGEAIEALDGAEVTAQAVTDENGVYKLAVPNAGTYKIIVPRVGIYDITEQDEDAAACVKSWAKDNGETGLVTVTCDCATIGGEEVIVNNGTISDINFGVVCVEIEADDAFYGINQGSVTMDTLTTLFHASWKDRSGNPGAVTIDEDCLVHINQMIAQGKTGAVAVTLRHTAEDASGMSVEKTVYLKLREVSSAVPEEGQKADYLAVTSFQFPVSGTLSAATARKMAFGEAIDWEGNAYKTSKISVDEAQLAAINAAIEEGEYAEEGYPLTFTTPGDEDEGVSPVSLTITVTLEGNVTRKGKIGVTDYLTVEKFTRARSAGVLTAEDIIRLSNISGLDKRGSSITQFTVDAETLAKLNNAILNRKPGIYRVAISSTGADAVTIQTAVTLTDSFTLAFSNNGGKGAMNSVTVNYGQQLVLAENTFTREGYTYGGWAATAAGDAAYEDGATLTASVVNRLYSMAEDPDRDGTYTATLYAAWNKIPGTAKINVSVSSANVIGSRDVYFDLYQDGVSVCDSISGEFSKTAAFNGAFTALDEGTYEVKMTCGQNIQSQTIVLKKNGTADAAFTFKGEIVYTVMYDAGQGTLPAGTASMARQISGYTYTLPECVPATTNMIFTGWKTADGTFYQKGMAVTGLYDGEESDVVINLTAEYQERVYYINYETGEGQIPADTQLPESYACGTAYTMPACESSNTGIVFAGWKDAEGHLFEAGQEVTNVYSGDKNGVTVTLTAVWQYTVSFAKEDAQFSSGYTAPQSWVSGEKYVLPGCTCSDPELVFAGWRAEDGSLYKAGSNAVNLFNTDEDGNGATLTAVWKNKTYTVSFNAGEGICLVASKSLAKEQAFGKLPTPVLEGAEFDGWFTAEEGGVQVTAETIFDNTQTQLYAHWKTATYNTMINGEPADEASFGEDYTFPVTDGYDVTVTIGGTTYTPINNEDGTYTIPGSDLKGELVIETVPGDAAYTTLTYMFEGRAVGTAKVLKTGNYPVVTMPVLTGYDVFGWYDAAEGGHKVSGSIEASGVTVLYAHKAAHTFSVSFDGEESSCVYGEEVVFEAPAARTGYEFLGWQIEGGAFVPYNGGEFVSFPMIDEDAVVTSCWQKIGSLVVTVFDELDAPVNGAIVKVTQGNTVIDGSGITDANGRAVFDDLPYGSYNIVVVSSISADETVVTTSGKDITEETNALTVTVPLFKLNTKVDSDDYKVTSEYLADAISESEKAEIRNTTGVEKEVVLVLKATKLDDTNTTDAAVKDSMDTFVEENADADEHQHLIEYVDLTVHQRITTVETGAEAQTEETTIPETNEYQVISIEITSDMYAALAAINGTPENIVVYRSHEGVVSAMTKGEDLSGECYWIKNVAGINYMVIKAKYFSVYAFGVQDEAVEYTTESHVVTRKKTAKTTEEQTVLTAVDTGVENWLITDRHFAYISGYTDGTVRPDGSITRAETAMIFYKLLKNKDIEASASFADVADGQWYTTAVRTLASLGILSGYTDGSFRPGEKISRAEFAAVAMKFAEMNDGNVTFTDVDPAFWAEKYISAAAGYGWISGYEDGTFRPTADIKRAEVASIVNKMLCRTADESYIHLHAVSLKQFADLQDETKWYYRDMVEATNDHEYVATAEGETWN